MDGVQASEDAYYDIFNLADEKLLGVSRYEITKYSPRIALEEILKSIG